MNLYFSSHGDTNTFGRKYILPSLLLLSLFSYGADCTNSSIIEPRVMRGWVNSFVQFNVKLNTNSTYYFFRWGFSSDSSKFKEIMSCLNVKACTLNSPFDTWEEISSNNNIHLSFTQLQKRNNGTYEFVAYAETRYEQLADLVVLVPPSKPQISNVSTNLQEGNNVTIYCTTYGANPPPTLTCGRKNLHETNSSLVSKVISSEPFGITNISCALILGWEDHLNNISCVAKHEGSESESDTLLLKVKFKPHIRAFEHNPYRVLEGNALETNCTAIAYPEVNRTQWLLPDGNKKDSINLSIKNITSSEAGEYTCYSYNSDDSFSGSSSQKLTVDVLYPPTVQLATLLTLKENAPLNISCNVSSNPQTTNITWQLVNGSVVHGPGLVIPRVKRAHAGIYNCTALLALKPSLGEPLIKVDTKGVQVQVLYAPISLSRINKVAIAFGQNTTKLTCSISAFGKPSFIWYIPNGAKNENETKYEITSMCPNPTWCYDTLLIRNPDESDLGNYICEATNTEGKIRTNITLQLPSVPDPPRDVRNASSTWDSVRLTWFPWFDGGSQQRFLVKYWTTSGPEKRPDDDDDWTIKQLIANSMITNISLVNVTGLYPSTNYSFVVYAFNDFGNGSGSNLFYFRTDDYYIPPIAKLELSKKYSEIRFFLNTSRCIRFEYSSDNGQKWFLLSKCITSVDGKFPVHSVKYKYRGYACELKRPDVCSEPVMADLMTEKGDISNNTLLIVGSVCGVIILLLLVVFLFFVYRGRKAGRCFRKRKNARLTEDSTPPNRRPQIMTVNMSSESNAQNGTVPHSQSQNPQEVIQPAPPYPGPPNRTKPYARVPPRAYDNDALDLRRSEMDLRSQPIFATHHSSKDPIVGASSDYLPSYSELSTFPNGQQPSVSSLPSEINMSPGDDHRGNSVSETSLMSEDSRKQKVVYEVVV